MKTNAKQYAKAFVEAADGADGKQLDAAAAEFVRLLAEKGSLRVAHDVIRAIETVWKETYGAATITVETAHPLSRIARNALESAAKGATVRDIVAPELIGGARLRIDDRIVDGSLAGQLEQLRTTLMI